MAQTCSRSYHHIVFSTKRRQPFLSPKVRPAIWKYMHGIAKERGFEIVEINGVVDHVHILIAVPTTITIARAVQLIKGGSSYWIRRTYPFLSGFRWQEGYGSFTIGQSQLPRTLEYLRNQEEHHRTHTFEQEYRAFVTAHGLTVDDEYLFD
jgi:REP element-mobilizing transposase RayT